MRPMSATRSAQLRLRVAALLPELVDRVLSVHEQRVDQRGQRVIIRTRPGAAVPLREHHIRQQEQCSHCHLRTGAAKGWSTGRW